ncbi:hypothetical protein JQX13_09175 [Archangium violaceum]|uniref:vWA domain-containing protein n=1 Tax=Archangium violaceum TaxID=83451 RepID=UPI00193BB282|nr:hypothetical protein [Archangium violaceum]QRK10243.1 hypothetical protein JQX13_09175 [Archangium violaceum]
MKTNPPKLQLLAAVAFSLLISFNEAAAQPPTERHTLILISNGESMSTVGADGITRLERAIQQARNLVNLPLSIPQYFAVWTFEGSSYIEWQGFSSATTTHLTLNSLQVGSGTSHPLAYALCEAADRLLAYRQGTVTAQKMVYLLTDGEENSTPVGTQCYGPSSALDAPNFTPGSWEWKVRNKFATGNPNTPPASYSYPLVNLSNAWSGYIQ